MADAVTVGALGAALRARWRLLVALVILGVLAGSAYGAQAPEAYTSKAVLFVSATPVDADGSYQAVQFADKRAATYPALLHAPEVLDRTITDLGLDLPASTLMSMVSASNPTDSSLVEVSATAGTPDLAQKLAATSATLLAEYAVDLEERSTKVGTVTITTAVPARVPLGASSPSPMTFGGLGGLLGGAIGVTVALTLAAVAARREQPAGPPHTARRAR